MPTAPRTLTADEPFTDLEDELQATLLTVFACDLTTQHAAPLAQLLAALVPLRAEETKLRQAVAAEDAKIPFADDLLNLLLDQAGDLLRRELGKEEGNKLLARLLVDRPASVVRRPVLDDQLETQRAWQGMLKATGKPALIDFGARVAAAVVAADAVLSAQAAAQTALDAFLAGPRTEFVAACNVARLALFGKLGEIVHAPENATLPPEFIDRFYLRDGSRRILRISDLDAMIPRLETKLETLKARREELKRAQKSSTSRKLKRQISARRAKLADRRKGVDAEEAAIAALEAELKGEKDEE